MELNIDFETYSEAKLKDVGSWKYIHDESFEILCFAYSIDGGKVKLWEPSLPIPKDFIQVINSPDVIIRAWNALFEKTILDRSKDFLKIIKQPSVKQYVDTMAIASFHTLPMSLDMACEALELPISLAKDKRGKYLLNKLTKPKKFSKATPFTRWTPENTPQDFKDLYEYCVQDVVAEMAILDKLPIRFLPKKEQICWQHTLIQNERGVHVDMPLVKDVLRVQNLWMKQEEVKLSAYTKGKITTGGQRARFIELAATIGYHLPDLTKDTVDKVLAENSTAPEPIKKLIEFRRRLSKTSTAKFKKILGSLCEDGTVKGNMQYYGTVTGRFAARGLQLQNLPRSKEKYPENLIRAFKGGLAVVKKEFGEDIMGLASKLVRPAIIPAPGRDLVVSDYSSIENRTLHFCANDAVTLQEFSQDLDQYKTFAAARYNVNYEDVTDEQRFHGKTAVLGLGYQMGAKTFIATCEGYGIKLGLDEATEVVNFYRSKYSLVVKLWYQLHKAAMECVKFQSPTKYHVTKFNVDKDFLYMILPSGRPISYYKPKLTMIEMPWKEKKLGLTFMGVNPYNRKWSRLGISPGRLTENLVQGLSRDILLEGLINVERLGYPVVASVHDEIISTYPEGKANMDEFNREMCRMPDWAHGLPLKAEGYIGKRYRKE